MSRPVTTDRRVRERVRLRPLRERVAAVCSSSDGEVVA